MNDSSDATPDIFSSLDHHTHVHHGHHDHHEDKHDPTTSENSSVVHDDAMFQLSHYVSDQLPHDDIQNDSQDQHQDHDGTTETALKMVDFHDNDSHHTHHHGGDSESATQGATATPAPASVSNFELDQHLDLLPSTEFAPASTSAPSDKIKASSNSSNSSTSSSSRLTTTTPTPPTRKDINVVAYAPDQKARRLGRPRNRTGISVDEVSASDNMDHAMMSKFRFDSLPVEGPGSRGGDIAKRRNPKGKITGQRKQAQSSLLNFFSVDKNNNDKEDSNEAIEMDMDTTPSDQVEQSNESPSVGSATPQQQDTTLERTPKPESTSQKSKKIINDNKKVESTPTATRRIIKPRIKHSHRITPVSRTTVINNRHKITRQFPGPLVGLYYDSYDDNTLSAKENQSTANEKIALGWPVKKTYYAADITYIIAFICKFNHVIEFPSIGPQDIEQGLGCNQDEETDDPESPVSQLMEQLFCKLLTLILNRKRPIVAGNYTKAIIELKAMTMFLGLPKEWRDDSQVFNDKDENILDENKSSKGQDANQLESPVDPQMTDILMNEPNSFNPPTAKPNPFMTKSFEQNGLQGISKPQDRLIMLRCLIQWILVASNEIKNAVTQSIQSQDIPGDKDTSYGARSVLKGFKMTSEVKRETEQKLAKRNKSANSSSSTEHDVRYIDPTSNPLDHSMRLRFDELIVGDIGFHIGRFYLVRMADESNGGLSSIDKMKYIWSSTSQEITAPPSQFKLYVQDVHRMLTESLAQFGIEFDEEGNEVKNEVQSQVPGDFWYEIASNATELDSFLKHLELRLGFGVTEVNPDDDEKKDIITEDLKEISKNSMIYKPLLNMYNYLSSMSMLIHKQEETKLSIGKSRSTRNKQINYSDAATSRKLRSMIDEDDDDEPQEYGEQFDENDHDEYDEVEAVESNDEDEDYSE